MYACRPCTLACVLVLYIVVVQTGLSLVAPLRALSGFGNPGLVGVLMSLNLEMQLTLILQYTV